MVVIEFPGDAIEKYHTRGILHCYDTRGVANWVYCRMPYMYSNSSWIPYHLYMYSESLDLCRYMSTRERKIAGSFGLTFW